MVALTRRHGFRKWCPDIGENRDLPEDERLYLEVAVGLTKQQLVEVGERINQAASAKGDIAEAVRAAYVDALTPYVRVFEGPHTVDGMRLETLGDYVHIVQQGRDAGLVALRDVLAAVQRFNSFAGPDELFSLRHSGGSAGTRGPSVVKDARGTASPSSGSVTPGAASSASTETASLAGK